MCASRTRSHAAWLSVYMRHCIVLAWMWIENIVELAIRREFARTMLSKQNIFDSHFDLVIEVNRARVLLLPTAAVSTLYSSVTYSQYMSTEILTEAHSIALSCISSILSLSLSWLLPQRHPVLRTHFECRTCRQRCIPYGHASEFDISAVKFVIENMTMKKNVGESAKRKK